jgi:hypothetical protein
MDSSLSSVKFGGERKFSRKKVDFFLLLKVSIE